MAANDLESAKEDLDAASERLQAALLPPDATAALGCLLEIKAGVGGSEASIFAGDLMRMYTRFAAGRGWKSELVNASAVSASTGSAGGSDAFREVIVEIDGQGAYQALRYEAGVHRVQRVPATESQGRVHTSTASVVVLPSGSDSDPSIEDVLDEKDVKVEVMRSGGAGGQVSCPSFSSQSKPPTFSTCSYFGPHLTSSTSIGQNLPSASLIRPPESQSRCKIRVRNTRTDRRPFRFSELDSWRSRSPKPRSRAERSGERKYEEQIGARRSGRTTSRRTG